MPLSNQNGDCVSPRPALKKRIIRFLFLTFFFRTLCTCDAHCDVFRTTDDGHNIIFCLNVLSLNRACEKDPDQDQEYELTVLARRVHDSQHSVFANTVLRTGFYDLWLLSKRRRKDQEPGYVGAFAEFVDQRQLQSLLRQSDFAFSSTHTNARQRLSLFALPGWYLINSTNFPRLR